MRGPYYLCVIRGRLLTLTIIELYTRKPAIVFSESTETGENGRIMEFSLGGTEKIKCLVEPTEEHYANLDPMYLDDQTITYLSVTKGESCKKVTSCGRTSVVECINARNCKRKRLEK